MRTRGGAGLRVLRDIAAAAALCVVAANVAVATESPQGDRAAAWPSAWRTYTLSSGGLVRDVIGDVGCGTGYCDVSSGGSGTSSSVYFASDGTNAFFRIRVKGDPRDAAHGGFTSTAYVLQIAVGGTAVVAVGLNGKPAQRDFVYVANATGTAYAEVYAYPFNNAGGQLSAGARGLPDGTGHYFVDWQVPLSRITAWSGGAVTGSTPIQLFFGTSQSANLAVINKDFMTGNAVDFGSGSTVTLVTPAPPPVPPKAGPTSPPGQGPTTSGSSTGGAPTLPNTSLSPAPNDPNVPFLVAILAVLAGARRAAAGRFPKSR